MMYDEQELRKAIMLLKPDNELFEIRVIDEKWNVSGYFTDVDVFISQLKRTHFRKNSNFYFTLNEINPACYSRTQKDVLVEYAKPTTSDSDITGYYWLMIDIDPKRPAGTSSTNEQIEKAKSKANAVYKFMKHKGWYEPIVSISGNGVHLLYAIGLKNTKENVKLVENSLKALDMLFSDDIISIDTSTFNPARICKIYGTMAQKGSNTAECPHRMSRIIKAPEEIKQNDKQMLINLAELLPKQEKTAYKNNYKGANFDIEDFIHKHNIRVSKVNQWSGGTKYVLDECLFDSGHKAPDAAICVLNNGAIAYHCFHNSCQNYKWQDVRLKFEPDAYRRKEQPRTTKPQPQSTFTRQEVQQEPSKDEQRFLRLQDIQRVDRSQIVSVPSGLAALDKKIIGFNKGEFSIWSGGNGSGKSTILSQLALETINFGFNAAIFSGELTSDRMKNWLHLQAAGRQYTKPTQYENVYYTPSEIGEKIDSWTGDKLWIYNNNYGMDVESVLKDIKVHMEKHSTDVVIIDNLMSLDMTKIHGDKYDRQTSLVLMLSDMAKQYNVHIHFVCHPRKPNGFLRKADISGTADLTNAADNVIMMHRVNNDFKNLAKQFFSKGKAEEYFNYNNVIEVMKNRDLGVEDELIGLYFERESKRMLNSPHENKIFCWIDFPFDDNGADNLFV